MKGHLIAFMILIFSLRQKRNSKKVEKVEFLDHNFVKVSLQFFNIIFSDQISTKPLYFIFLLQTKRYLPQSSFE